MLYLYHKRAHILSICAFVLLAAGNAALIITHGGEVSLTDDLGIILLTLIPLAFYLLTIVFPGATYHYWEMTEYIEYKNQELHRKIYGDRPKKEEKSSDDMTWHNGLPWTANYDNAKDV